MYVSNQFPNVTVNVVVFPIIAIYCDKIPVTPVIFVVIIGFVEFVKKFTGLDPNGIVEEI